MKIGFKLALISTVFGAGLLMAELPAVAAETSPAPSQHEITLTAQPSYYTWHKHRYLYRYKGRYYNHRARRNGFWYYS